MRVAALIVIAACGGGSSAPAPIDCKTLLADPGNALAKLTERESDPAKLWETLENCAAPGGDVCAKSAVGLAMTPSMARSDDPTAVADREAQYAAHAARCRNLPPNEQQCLLVSYGSTHAECGAVQEAFRRAQPAL